MVKGLVKIVKSVMIMACFLLVFGNNIVWASNKTEVNSQIITPEQFGAIGDGVADDTIALRNTFDYACKNDGVIIRFGKNKNYLISSGITLPKTSILDGNDSQITVKEIKSYKNGGNYSYQFFSEYEYNKHANLLDWKNLTIDFSPTLLLNEKGYVKEYLLFRFYDLECFKMSNVKIISNGDKRNQINLFKFCGQGQIYMDNCVFDVRHRGIVGSALWIQSTLSGGYYARINNTSFYSTGSDEIVSIFCSGSHDVIFDKCKIEKNYYDTYYNKSQQLEKTMAPFINSVYQITQNGKIVNASHYVTYQNCELICRPINRNSDVDVTFCGLNSYYGDIALTKFENCNIIASNIGTMVGGEQAINNQFVTNISNNEIFHSKIKAVFDRCNMYITTGKYGLIKSNSSNLEICNSNVITNKVLDYNWANLKTVTSYEFKLLNNNIAILGDNDYIFTVNKRAKEQYKIINNNFILNEKMKDKVSLLMEKNTADGYDISIFTHEENARYHFQAIGNRINGEKINDIDK